MTLDAITVLQTADGRPANKIVSRTSDGIKKQMAPNSGRFVARTVPVPDVATMAAVLREVGERADTVISLSLFRDAPESEFVVVPAKEMAARLGVEEHDREALAGFHQIDGVPTAARIKESMEVGSWLLFDRDMVDGMPAALAKLSFDEWREAVDLLFPGFATCGCVVVPSTTNRVTVDGAPLSAASCHVLVKIDDPAHLPRAWSQAALRALTTEFQGTLLGFAKPKHCRRTGQVVATDWWTLYDKSVAAIARLVFDGAPVMRGDGLAVLPPVIEVHDGPVLELARVRDLMPRKEKGALEDALEQIRGTRPTINLMRKSGVGRVTGVEIVTADLTMDLEIETASGWTTVGALHAAGAGHTRCQSPFRESESWAAFYNFHRDGTPFIFDTGTHEKHVLRREGRATMSEIIREWLVEDYQPRFVCRDGSIFSERLGKPLKLREVTPTDEIIDRLTMASDAPCDDKGQVKRLALPTQFNSWLKAAWGVLLRILPAETATVSASAREALEQQLAALLKTMVTVDWGGQRRHSLGAWARYHAALQPGKWCRVGSFDLWGRITAKGLQIALLPTLAGQVWRAHPEIAEMSEKALTKRCNACGLGVPDEDNRIREADGERFRVTILNERFVQSLALPDAGDDALASALAARFSAAPRGEGGGRSH
jgi:hypothetical protein